MTRGRLPARASLVAVTALLLGLAAMTALVASSSLAATKRPKPLTPVVLFPAFHFTKLEVTVHNQTVAPGCPRSGNFEDYYENPHPSTRSRRYAETS
jgi:lysophospholipase-3